MSDGAYVILMGPEGRGRAVFLEGAEVGAPGDPVLDFFTGSGENSEDRKQWMGEWVTVMLMHPLES